jgi:hypothetical protein
MRFAHFPTINSVLSNAAGLRLQSCQVVGLPMENLPPMTRRDGASVITNLNEGCETPNAGTPHATGQRAGSRVFQKRNSN